MAQLKPRIKLDKNEIRKGEFVNVKMLVDTLNQAVLVPTPAKDSSRYDAQVSPQPPSPFCMRSVQSMARPIAALATPNGASALTTTGA